MVKRLFFGMVKNQIATACCIMFSMLANGIFVGKFLGAQDMAAYGLISPIYLFMSTISTTFAVGSSTYCSMLLGKGNIQKAKEVFTTNAVALTFLSVILTFAVIFFADELCVFFGATNENSNLKENLIAYIYGFAPAFFAMAASLALISFLYIEGAKKRILISVVASTFVNIIGDFLNVLVFHGGLFGIAVATSLSYYVSFIILALYYRQKTILFFTRENFSFKPLYEIVTLGFSNAISRFSVLGRTFAINSLLATNFSQIALVAFSVRTNLDSFLGAFVIGISSTILTLGAVYVGEEDKKSLHILYKLVMKYGLMLVVGLSVTVFLFAEPIVSMYLPNSPEAVAETVRALRFYIVSLPLYLIGLVYVSLCRVLKKKFFSTAICALEDFGFIVFFAYVLGYNIGLDGVWISFFFGEIATLIFIFINIYKNCGHFPKTIDDLIMLPNDFDESPKERLRLTIKNMDEVIKASAEVHNFLLAQKVSKRNAYIMALSVEEMTGNIIRWSFESENKNTISIYLVFKNDEWILRIRDDCKPFNPKKWAEIAAPAVEDNFKNMGIRLVMFAAKNIEYINVLRINNLIIKVPQN